MSNNKKMAAVGILASMAAMLSLGGDSFSSGHRGSNDGSYGHGIPDKPKKVIPKGCKVFTIRGIEVVALTYDRAWDKLKKKRPDLFFKY